MKKLSFILMMLIAGTGVAAGLQQLFDSLKKPAPQSPQSPKPPVKK